MTMIPVRETIVGAYRYTFGHFGKIISLIWLPQILTTVGSYYCVKPYMQLVASNPDGAEILQNGSIILNLYAFCFVSIFLSAWIVCVVVRAAANPTQAVSYFSFPSFGAFFRMAGSFFALIGIVLFCVLGMALVGGIAKAIGGGIGSAVAMAIIAVGLLGLCFVGIRLSFLLAPIVVLEERFGLFRSWEMTKGYFWRILAIVLACTIPMALVSEALQMTILGPAVLRNFLDAFAASPDAIAREAQQMRLFADRLPLLMGLSFFLAPFTYGLLVAPTVLAYQTLTKPTVDAAALSPQNAHDGP